MFGENDTNYWAEKTEYSTPTAEIKGEGIKNGTIGDYFGIPTNVPVKVKALPARAYAMIYNEWFRDENLEAPIMVGYKKTDQTGNSEDPEVDATKYANSPDYTAKVSEGAIYATKPAKAGKYRDWETDRKSTRLNSSHRSLSRMPSSA